MSSGDLLLRFPERLPHSLKRPEVVYLRQPDVFAVQGATAARLKRHPSKARFKDEGIAVFAGEPADQEPPATGERLLAVYAQAGGSIAVPTGRVMINFGDDAAIDRKADIARAGFRIERTLDYAPSAAWLVHASGDVSQALQAISSLEKLPRVENVEPQMLMHRSQRS
jgi:hypothetical protein